MTATSIISEISVVIPLYNKAAEIERTLLSVLAQSVQPREIIVVDDGSTDGSAEIVERMASPLLRLVRQSNTGVSAARNKAISLASGRWVALLDGDDRWCEDYLLTMAQLIEQYPECGAYGSAFYVDNGDKLVVADTPQSCGVVNFFEESMRRYVLIPSASILRRDLVIELGGFPEGMRMGEDQYLWAIYSRAASNRSAAIFRPEQTKFSLEDLYDVEASAISNEYVARVALGKALVESTRGGTAQAQRAVEFFAYNKLSGKLMHKVKVLNRLPAKLRPSVMAVYNWLAWAIARKGL